MSALSRTWKHHGTKILGYGSALIGVLEAIDEKTVNLLAYLAGPKWGPIVSAVIMAGAGIAVAFRGHTNSTQANPPA